MMFIYVIYFNPFDFPGDYVLKRMIIKNERMNFDMNFIKLTKTLEEARSFLPPGLVNVDRQEADDPVIVECWI